MGQKLLRIPDRLHNAREQFEVFDHFVNFTDTDLWTIAVAANGTSAHQGPGRSNHRLFSTTDNDAAVLATTHELFLFAAGKDMYAEARVNFDKPGTLNGGFAFGWADAMAATLVADDGGGIVIANEGALLTTIEGDNVWSLTTEMDGTQTSTASTTVASDGTWQTISLEVLWRNSTTFHVRGFVDGAILRDSNGYDIEHEVTLGTATDMDFGAVLKGHHADDYIGLLDYVYASQLV